MAKQILDIKSQLKKYKFEANLLQKIDCSKDENKKFKQLIKEKQTLPDGIYQYKSEMGDLLDTFYRIHVVNLTEQETQEFIMFKQLEHLKSIKNSMIFFVALTVISIIATFVLLNR